jgi:hypothetical protein
VLSKILLAVGLVLLAVKFGLRARLRELASFERLRAFGRAIDRFVNIMLVIIVVTYLVQIALMIFSKN